MIRTNIDWEKFFKEWKGKLVVMHCKTLEEATAFCKIMHDNGLQWYDGESYLENHHWYICKENSCYEFNCGHCCHLDSCKAAKYPILEFEDYIEHEDTQHKLYVDHGDGTYSPLEEFNCNTFHKNKVNIHADICKQLTDTYKAKDSDYGDSFANLRREYPTAILVRLFDKYGRLKTLLSQDAQEVTDESIEDTLLDMANYCILEVIERRLESEAQ